MAGLFGLSCEKESGSFCKDFFWGTFYQQHLGEEVSGIAICGSEGGIKSYSKTGLFRNNFSPYKIKGYSGIGYCGHKKEPFETNSRLGRFAVCFSGTISNIGELAERFKNFGHTLKSEDSEAEILAKLIAQGRDYVDGLTNMVAEAKGSYAFLLIESGGIHAIRSANGHWPLVLGVKNSAVAVASDSSGFDNLGFKIARDVRPGEIVFLSKGRIKTEINTALNNSFGPCSFHWIYTGFPGGKTEGVPLSLVRKRMGMALAKRDIDNGFIPDIVTLVPDSGRMHAIGYYQEFIRQLKAGTVKKENIPFYDELLFKFSHTGRSFTPQTEEARAIEADHKLIANGEDYRGMKIVVCDDSVVRGNQIMNNLVPKLKRLGVEEIHFRISSPKIFSHCPWGGSVKKKEALAATMPDNGDQMNLFKIDGLEYNSIEDLREAIGIRDLCFDCMIQSPS